MIVVDTNHLDVLMYGGERAERLTQRLTEAMAEHAVATTIVNVQEKVVGWLNKINSSNREPLQQPQYYSKLHDLVDFFGRWVLLPFDDRAALEFDRLRKQRLGLGPMDLRIASIALCHGALVLTRNLRDFRRVPDLQVEDWFPY